MPVQYFYVPKRRLDSTVKLSVLPLIAVYFSAVVSIDSAPLNRYEFNGSLPSVVVFHEPKNVYIVFGMHHGNSLPSTQLLDGGLLPISEETIKDDKVSEDPLRLFRFSSWYPGG